MKKKVLHIITKLEMGGAQGNTLYTVANLSRDLFEPILVCGPGGMLDEHARSGKNFKLIECHNLLRQINPVKDFMALCELYLIIRREKPHIIHTHSSKAGILARLAAFLAGVPRIIHTFHGFGFHDNQNILTRTLFIWLEKISSFYTDNLIFVSKENILSAQKENIGKKQKYSLIRSGIKLDNYRNTKKNKAILFDFKINPSHTIIATLGNLKPQKNPDDFFKIAKEIIKQKDNVSFIYIGGGERLDEFRLKSENSNLNGRCVFAGWQKNSKDILCACDIFALTSLWEGLPRSLVEAMSCGLLPVCYATDGVLDIIKDEENGFLIPQKNTEQFKEKLLFLLENKDIREKTAKNAFETDLSDFDIDLMVKKQEQLYSEEK